MPQDHSKTNKTSQLNAVPDQNELGPDNAPDEYPADTDPPPSRTSLSLSRRGILASLLTVSGLSLLNEPASAVRGSFQSPTETAGAANKPFSSPITLSNPEPDEDDFFGGSVALSADGTTALIGAARDDTGACEDAGEAYVFTRTAEGWDTDNPVTIPNPDRDAHDLFGDSVAVNADGTTALVSAPPDDTEAGEGVGTVYVFRRTAEGWNIDNPVIIPNPEPEPAWRFGDAVALSADGTTALVGARYWTGGPAMTANPNEGIAYLFRRTAEGWDTDTPVALRNPTPPSSGDEEFGSAVALNSDGTTALIGAPHANPASFPGEAYLFTRTAEGWNTDNPVIILNPADIAQEAGFGGSVALNGDGTTALVSALSRGGEAYLFTRTAEGWDIDNPVAFPVDSSVAVALSTGVALSTDGAAALTGGSLFRRTAEGWDTDNPVTLCNPAPDEDDEFGEAVAMNADATTLLVGAPGEWSNGDHNAGAAYLYEQETQSLISADHASSGDTFTEQRGGTREWIRRHRRWRQ